MKLGKSSVKLIQLIMFCMVVIKAFSNTSMYMDGLYDKTFQLLSYSMYLVMLLFCIKKSIKKKSFIYVSIIALIIAIPVVYNKNIFVFVTFVAIMACYKENFRNIVKSIFVGEVLSVLLIIFLNIIGILPSIEKYNEGGLRISLGFRHANTLGLYFLSISLMAIILYYKSWKLIYNFYIVFVIVFMFVTCRSKTSMSCCALAILLVWFFKKFGKKIIDKMVTRIALIVFVPFCMIATYMFALYYEKSGFLQILNKYATDRLFLNYKYFEAQPIKLLSKPFTLEPWYLDSCYSNLLLFNGLIVAVAFILINCLAIYKAICHYDYGVIICILVFGIYGFFELGGMFFWFNATLLYFLTGGKEIQEKQRSKKRKNGMLGTIAVQNNTNW